MKKAIILLFLFVSVAVNATTYYLAPSGSDASGDGSITSPWFTLNKAWAVAKAGDIVYLRGGEYMYTVQQTLSNKSGSAGNLIKIWAYPGEIPVLKHTTSSGWFILMENSNYIHFKGIEVSGENHIGSGLNWEMYNCNNNILENLNYHHMIQGLFIRGQSDGNLVLNCDFHHNQDPNSTPAYEHADGFGFNWSDAAGLTNTVRGCRFYWNCDDGMDMWANDNNIIIDNCWTFYNGYIPGTFTAVGTGGAGFKFGISDADHGSTVLTTVKNCIAYRNKGWGYNQNGANARLAFYNNIAYLNVGMAFWLNDYATKAHILTNNIAYGNGSVGSISSASVLTTNTFLLDGTNNPSYSVSDADFQSLDGNQLLASRKSDGSLPDITFLKLASTSALIDKGTDVGLPYSGTKPDLGPSETTSTQLNAAPVYTSSVVANATPAIIQMTYNQSLANIVPAVSAFNVLVNSLSRTINSAAIVGSSVQLTLTSPIVSGDLVTVSYTVPATNPLQTTAGGQAVSTGAQTVTNSVSASAVIPVYASAAVGNTTPSLLELTYNTTLASIVPAASAFSVLVNSIARTVSAVAISGTKVQLTLASPVVPADVIIVSYTIPSSNPLQTTTGGQAASISAQTVTNSVTIAIPVYSSATVANATPSLLEMTYNLTLANILPAVSAFSVLVNSVARTVNTVAISGTIVQLTLSTAIKYGDIVNVSYTVPETNPLQVSAGGTAASISGKSVVNNLINATKDATPVTVTMTLSPYHVHMVVNVLLEYSSSLATQAATITPEILRISDLSGNLFVEKFLVTGVTSIKIPLNLRSGIYNVLILGNDVVLTSRKMKVH
jgi:uncharacterized repeat protein (TIGR02059 family)